MAKKPRKREYVPPTHEVLNKKEGTRTVQQRPAKGARTERGPGGRVYRMPPEPSFRRTLRRLPIYFLLLFGLQYFLISSGKQETTQEERLVFSALQAGMVTVVFAPFMYWMERWSYRMQMRRIERDKERAAGKP